MLRFKRLNSDEEFEYYRDLFLACYQRYSSAKANELPLAYLRSCEVIGVFDSHQKMVAGYTIGTAIPFRLLEFVPEPARAKLMVPFQGDWKDCCEISCMWREPEVSQLFMSARLWPWALIGVLRSGKKILLGHNQNPRLDRFYTTLNPRTIYEGVSSLGYPSRLFAYNRSKIILSILGFWVFETPRRLLKAGNHA